MKRSRVLLAWVLLACLSMTAPAVLGQTQTQTGTQEYTPKEGQPGKDVIWLPTALTMANAMLDLAKVTAQDYVIDLGSGDGRLVITAAKRGARALGIEYNPDLVEVSKRNAAQEGVSDKAEFVKADIFESDFSEATVITMFLLPELNLKLRPKILNLRPGTRIVSNTFRMGDWSPDETLTVQDQCTTYCDALLWIVPAKVAGEWKLPQGRLTLKQTYQTVAGTLETAGKRVPIQNGKVRGDEISFTAGGAQYVGQVSRGTMQGTFTSAGSSGTWSAARAAGRRAAPAARRT